MARSTFTQKYKLISLSCLNAKEVMMVLCYRNINTHKHTHFALKIFLSQSFHNLVTRNLRSELYSMLGFMWIISSHPNFI